MFITKRKDNMREIKFRSWNNKTKTMSVPFLLEYALKGYMRIHNVEDWKDTMQFTGLKDKNGKEIYEGDIVTSCHYNYYTKDYVLDRTCSEEHNLQKGIVEFVQYNCSFMIMKRFNGSELVNQWNNSIKLQPVVLNEYEIEIIGNIYENKDLLDVSK